MKESNALRLYGIALLITNAGTGLFWLRGVVYKATLSPSLATCWPFSPWCRSLPAISWALPAALTALIVLSALSVPLFMNQNRLRAAWWSLFLISVFRFLIYQTDYAYMGNYHYMNFAIIGAYLFAPRKRELIPLLLVGFYVASASLKFNYEWLSGAALLRSFWLKGFLLRCSLIYVVVLEGIGSWALISERRAWRILFGAQFVAFHFVSYFIVGWFYPFIMLCLISFLALLELEENPAILNRLLNFSLGRSTAVFIAVFVLAQALPRIFYRDPALSGVPRLISLNMLDATPICQASFLVRSSEGFNHLTGMSKLKNIRTSCDPIEFLSQAEKLCKSEASGEVSFNLRSRRKTDLEFIQVLNLPDACHTKFPLALAELFQEQRRLDK